MVISICITTVQKTVSCDRSLLSTHLGTHQLKDAPCEQLRTLSIAAQTCTRPSEVCSNYLKDDHQRKKDEHKLLRQSVNELHTAKFEGATIYLDISHQLLPCSEVRSPAVQREPMTYNTKKPSF